MKKTTTQNPVLPRFLIATIATLAVIATFFVVPASADAATSTSGVSSVIPRQSAWSYHHGSTAPKTDWQTSTSNWPVGTAPFGKGARTGETNTTIAALSGRQPLSTYFTKSFTLTSDLPEWAWMNTWADDGIVVWVNGVEVGRKNAPTTDIHANSYATKAPSTTAARKDPVTFKVPANLLRAGKNTVAVQVLSNWRLTPNVSFDAHLVREDRSNTPTTPAPPTTPTPPVVPTPPKPTTPPAPVPPVTTPGGEVANWGAPSWRDEFTYTDAKTGKPAVDPTKWNVRGRDDLGLLFDAAVVDREQVTVDGSGILHIRADWMNTPVTRPAGQSGPSELWHKTGYLDQRKLETGDVSLAQQYGRWEIRAKTPTGPNTFGSLAAFWLRNNQSGEIDIMEAWGYDDKAVRDQRINTSTTTIHTHTSTPSSNQRYIWHHADFGAETPVWDDFHVYAFEFTPTYAAVLVDGKEMLRATPKTHPNLWNQNYFGSPLHMRLNLHVGPSEAYWGLPDPNNRAATQNLDFQVDYVRVWEYDGN